LLPDDQVHPDTHVLTMVNNVIGVVNYVIAARPSLRNFVIADTEWTERTYAELLRHAALLLSNGEPVIADASWTSQASVRPCSSGRPRRRRPRAPELDQISQD